MQIDPTELTGKEAYRLLVSAVVPRPIGWTSTQATDGTLNLAPFSFFNAISSRPPMVVLGIGHKDGRSKDTARNILDTGEFVVNIVSRETAQAMNITSAGVDPEVDEFQLARLTPAPSTKVAPPRVEEAKVSLECKLVQRADLDIAYDILLGDVVHYHIDEAILTDDGLVDAEALDPVARLGGSNYAGLGELFQLDRPTEVLDPADLS